MLKARMGWNPESPTNGTRSSLLAYLRDRRDRVARTLAERRELISRDNDAAEIRSLDDWIAWLSGDEVEVR
jgi:hypothetical protein